MVSRARFVPAFFVPAPDEPGWVVVRDPDPAWRAGVDGDDALMTQVDGVHAEDAVDTVQGAPTSSSSAPPLMARMLDALDVRAGHHVLEIGTGTGYHAALLAERGAIVTSIDVDPTLTERARTRLRAHGVDADLVTGDGMHPPPGHYDRIIATVAVDRVPRAWLATERLVAPLDRGGPGGLLVALDADGARATGRVLPTYGAFMPLRAHARAVPSLPDTTGAAVRPTTLSTAEVTDPRGPFEFFVALRLGGLTPLRLRRGRRDEHFVLRGDSWACLPDDHAVAQGGPERLWDQVEALHAEWVALGRPSRERFGLTVDGDDHIWWFDDPDSGPRWRFS